MTFLVSFTRGSINSTISFMLKLFHKFSLLLLQTTCLLRHNCNLSLIEKYHMNMIISRVFLQRQLWIVNYYVKSSFWHFKIHILSRRQQKHQCLCFHYWDDLTNFWRNNWRSIIDIVERLGYRVNKLVDKLKHIFGLNQA